jgi:hypothetical protein
MDTPQKDSPKSAVERALGHLKQAEADLMAAIGPGDHPDAAALLEVHAFLWEAISTLSQVVSGKRGQP